MGRGFAHGDGRRSGSRRPSGFIEQLRRLVPGRDRKGAGDDALLQAVLAAFPDRVARQRRDGELLLSTGGSARMAACRHEFLIAVDMEETHKVAIWCGWPPIQAEWLLDRVAESYCA